MKKTSKKQQEPTSNADATVATEGNSTGVASTSTASEVLFGRFDAYQEEVRQRQLQFGGDGDDSEEEDGTDPVAAASGGGGDGSNASSTKTALVALVARYVKLVRGDLRRAAVVAAERQQEAEEDEHEDVNRRDAEIAGALKRIVDCALSSDSTGTGVGSLSTTSTAGIDTVDVGSAVLELVAALLGTSSVSSSVLSPAAAALVVHHAVDYTTAAMERIRVASCLFLGKVAEYHSAYAANNNNKNKQKKKKRSSAAGASSSLELIDAIVRALVPRATDKSAKVRLAFCYASAPFASSSSRAGGGEEGEDQDIVTSLLYLAQHDPVIKNRVAALTQMPLNLRTVEPIVARMRDVASQVRVAAAAKLAADGGNGADVWDAELRAATVQAGWTERYVGNKIAPRTAKALVISYSSKSY